LTLPAGRDRRRDDAFLDAASTRPTASAVELKLRSAVELKLRSVVAEVS
jgi:hypothetical protein